MKEIVIDEEVTLVPYYPNYDETFAWYQDKDVCKQVDNIDHVYSMDTLVTMYTYLSTHGDCFYISCCGKLVGDVTLRDNNEVCIVVCKEYQNKHIGRRCIGAMINLAKEKEISEIKANIYSFNAQSQRMFESIGLNRLMRNGIHILSIKGYYQHPRSCMDKNAEFLTQRDLKVRLIKDLPM